MLRWAGFLALMLCGCGRYDNFTLPSPASPPANTAAWKWEPEPEPVIGRGAPGEFDSVDALNPSIARFGGQFVNAYSGWDGKVWRTGIATSPDGRVWTKKGAFLQPGPAAWEGSYIAANGSLLAEGDTLSYWYQGGNPPQIGLARAAGLDRWEKLPAPVLTPGPRGAWDERGVADPYVIHTGGRYYMYFLGQDRARRQRLGVAVSSDGVTWTKSLANPILELGPPGAFDELGLGEPAVWAHGGRWWMLYTARDKKEWRRMGLAVSPDGIRWTRLGEQPVISTGPAWNSRVVCDAEVAPQPDGSVQVWFGGGDRPEPAENLHGQIGFGVLRPVAVAP